MYKQTFLLVDTGMAIYRKSRLQVLPKEGVLKNVTKFTGKHLWCSLFLKKKKVALNPSLRAL